MFDYLRNMISQNFIYLYLHQNSLTRLKRQITAFVLKETNQTVRQAGGWKQNEQRSLWMKSWQISGRVSTGVVILASCGFHS